MSNQSVQESLPAAPERSADEYASAITSVVDDIIAAIESCTGTQWTSVTAAEQWPVSVVAHHAGTVLRAFAGVLEALGSGAPVPQFSADDVDRSNARHAQEFGDVSRAETLTFLRTNTAALTAAIRRLPEERITQVAGSFGGFELTVAQLLEFAVIAHLQEHLASIRTTIAGDAARSS